MSEESNQEDEYDEDYDYDCYDLDLLEYHLSISKPSLFEVTTCQYIEKLIYIFQINEDKSITGLTLEEVPKLSKYKKSSTKSNGLKQWQMQTLFLESFKLKKYESPPIVISSMFIKYGWDQSVEYGDGGYSELKYPIYRIEKLPINEEKLSVLVNSLLAIGKQRKDHHQDAPVIDIIDPDLNPNYFYTLMQDLKSLKEANMPGFLLMCF